MLRSENEIVFPFEKCIIFTVVPFVDYLSHLVRGLYNVVYNLCPIPLSFCNKICLIYDNIVDNCQLIKYNLQDTFSLFRNSIMLFQLVKSKFQDAFM